MKKGAVITDIEIIDIGAKGMVIGKKDGEVFMCKDVVPGDVVSLEMRRKKKGVRQGVVKEITKQSPLRTESVCEHFNHCGGCNWQNLQYAEQLKFKERRVKEQIRRIAGLTEFESLPILGSQEIYHYRNKLEFTFVSHRWLTPKEIEDSEEIEERRGVGFHVPGRFDWVLHVNECHLQDRAHNSMRQFVYDVARELDIAFYHPRDKTGILRNILFRNNRKGEWMILLVVQAHTKDVKNLVERFLLEFPSTYSFWVIVNEKVNDSFSDCPAELIKGEPHLVETFQRPNNNGEVDYIIGPKSFFQTNPNQAEHLYSIVYDFAGLTGQENVYDLYTGTGSIALIIADGAKQITGIEYVPEAIEDAIKNTALNNVNNANFYAGDMKDVLTSEFIAQHGQPDVLITDPPRAGMHVDVVQRIIEACPKRIVYVSCDPATQARDIDLLKERYQLIKIQPVDMFPHTSHVENVALLELK